MKLEPEEIAEICRAHIRQRGPDRLFRGLNTDSRRLKRDELFFALSGPHYDGHEFVPKAFRTGASGAVIKKGRRIAAPGARWLFSVTDPLRALGDTAAAWRKRFDIPVIGVTGSNGKTTTREMIAQILATRYHVLKTEKNFNNLIGLPLTLNRLNRRHQVAVLEMGMNIPGEIARLSKIAQPTIGVITNIARAHLAGLGSLAAVRKAKAEILPHLPADGLAVLNADDPRVLSLAAKSRAQVVTFGFGPDADVRGRHFKTVGTQGSSFEVSGAGHRFQIRLSLPGQHNASNALAAIAVGHHLGIASSRMGRALRQVQLPAGRMEEIRLKGGTLILNDSYNANPDSVLQALRTLTTFPNSRRKVVVLGDMLELGRFSRKSHREIGQAAVKAGCQELFAVGQWADEILAGAKQAGLAARRQHRCQDSAEAGKLLQDHIEAGDLILLKASRGVGLERVLNYLKRKAA